MSRCSPNCKCQERCKKVIYIKNPCPTSCNNPKPPCNPVIINLYLSSISPTGGQSSGNNTATLNGNGLSYAKAINFGNIQITTFNLINDNQISFIVPAMTSAQSVQVSVATTSVISNALCYNYVTPSTITQIIPNQGPEAGNNQITIFGTFLSSTQSIQFGASTITNFQIINDTTISFIAPSGTGTINVNVTSLAGNSNVLIYEYVPAPII